VSDLPESRLSPELRERLERYLAGGMDPAERAGFEREALGSADLCEILYQDAALQHRFAATATGPPRALQGRVVRGPWRAWWVAFPAAAALAVLVWFAARPPGAGGPGGALMRGGGAPVHLIFPVGEMSAQPDHFAWGAVPGAGSYRLEVFDAESRILLSRVTSDTSVSLEAGALPDSVVTGRWRVVPLDSRLGEMTGSEFQTFRLRRP
jgi:hypothetical protein